MNFNHHSTVNFTYCSTQIFLQAQLADEKPVLGRTIPQSLIHYFAVFTFFLLSYRLSTVYLSDKEMHGCSMIFCLVAGIY